MNEDSVHLVEAPPKPSGIWTRAFCLMFISSIAFNMGLEMSNSLTAIYASRLGATADMVGFVASSYAMTALVFRLISASVIDTFNRKYLVLFAAVALAVAFWGFGISDSIPKLIGFRLLQGCAMAFGNACCLAIVADMLPKDKYSSGLGYYSLAQVVCGAIGPSVGLALVAQVDFRMTFSLTSCFMLLAAFFILLVKINFKRTKKFSLSIRNIIATEALLPLGIQFLSSMGGTSVWAFLFVYAGYRGISGNIGLYYTISAIAMLISRPLFGRLTDRYGLVKVVAPAMLFNIATLMIICYSTTIAGFFVAAVVTAFGQGACGPALQALTMKSVPSDRRGAASSTMYICWDLSSILSAIIAGQIVRYCGYTVMWYTACVPYIAAMAVLVWRRKAVSGIERNFEATTDITQSNH